MALSSANVVQAKTGSAFNNATAAVALDAGTQAGSTVTVEIAAGGVPLTDSGFVGRIPDGFEFDASSALSGTRYLYCFRKSRVAAGEGVSGSTSWDFTYVAATSWVWRVTEWDAALEPIGPLEAVSAAVATGTSPTELSTGTATANRSDVVCLVWHHWHRASNTGQSFDWSGHTNSFTERDEVRLTQGILETDACWSWLFSATGGSFETTATINLTTRNAADIYLAMLVVYAATTGLGAP